PDARGPCPPRRERVAAPWSYLPSNQGRHAGLGHAGPRPRTYINTAGENVFGAVPADRNGTPAVGRALAVGSRDVRYAEGAGAAFAPADGEKPAACRRPLG